MDKKKKAAARILEKLEQAGYQAYFVGGCVRDQLLQRQPKDYDICTNALPEQVQQIFEHTIPTGLKHGTVTVIEENMPFEVTTFRQEGDYNDYRRPKFVTFVSQLETDLSRRDFTMNAIAQDRFGNIYDPFEGRKDLERRCIRCVGDPMKRFSEDALRMIRAARFAAQFCFSFDDPIQEAMRRLKGRLQYLAIERIVDEMEKIWSSRMPSKGLQIFWEYDLWSALPVFRSWSWKQVDDQEIEVFDWIDDRIVRWCYLFYLGNVSVQEIQTECQKLTLAKKDISKIKNCFQLADQWHESVDHRQLKLYLLRFGFQVADCAYQLSELIHLRKPSSAMRKKLRNIWESMPVRSASELLVNGSDLLNHTQRRAGPWISQTIDYLLVRVALGEIPNQKQILLKEGCQFAAKNS